MAQQRADVALPPGVGVAAQDYSSSGQAGGGGTGGLFGDLGGPGQQHGDDLPQLQDSPRNAYGNATGNPSGGGDALPPRDSVFGDLGGSGTAGQTGGEAIPPAPRGTDPGGQGGM
jgi:hypothetical protein